MRKGILLSILFITTLLIGCNTNSTQSQSPDYETTKKW